MERIAIISDLHGSFLATKEVIENIKSRGINRIFCLGDLIAKGPCPNETIDLIKEIVK